MRFETRNVVGRAKEVSLSSTPTPPRQGVWAATTTIAMVRRMEEASVVVCEPLKPPRLCHTENQPEVRKTATQKRARGAHAVLCTVRAVRLFPPMAAFFRA